MLRRVKSFSVNKCKSSEELKSKVEEAVVQPRVRKKYKLKREKSVSMDHIPIRIPLHENELFQRQREKLGLVEDVDEVPKRAKDNVQTKERLSQSYSEEKFAHRFPQFETENIEWRRVLRPSVKNRGRYRTMDVENDLITDIANGPLEQAQNLNKPGTFPVCDEDEVQVRETRHPKAERPKTLGSTIPKQRDHQFEIRGVRHVEVGQERCLKVHEFETLHFWDGQIYLLDQTNTHKTTIARNLQLKKSLKVSKKEVEVRAADGTIYRLYFELSKDAKVFLEVVKTQSTKNAAPWWQLPKLLKKRSSRDILESKGIIKNEPIFGNTLEELCDADHPVPEVITRIVEIIEEPSNIRSLGLYRASANLAVLQNIRFEINCGRWEVLDKYSKDVDVLAGALKLFFRELKQPLISNEVYQKLQRAISTPGSRDDVRGIVETLPQPHKATLLFIIKHLLKVCEQKEHNKMDFHNMSICWGPSLITLPDNCIDLVTQTTEFTRIVEHLLNFYHDQKIDVVASKSRDSTYDLVHKLIQIIDGHLNVEGIYRKSGSSSKIDKIMKLVERKNLSELDNFRNDVHELCCVLKKVLASLIPQEFFLHYCQICDTQDDQVLTFQVKKILNDLARKDVLFLLVDHLVRVLRHESRNRMSMTVLSDIWMTTLLGTSSGIQSNKKTKTQLSRLFKILLSLNEKNLPDLVAETDYVRGSKYDNVPEDTDDDDDVALTTKF